MKSAGNDIVALAKIDKQKTRQYRFYSKILSSSEQALYHQPQLAHLPFDKFVWLLWSVKESAYKFLKRNLNDLVFSPVKIVVHDLEPPPELFTVKSNEIDWILTDGEQDIYKGKLSFNGQVLYFRSKVSETWIASVVNNDDKFENIQWGAGPINDDGYDNQSNKARELLLNKLNSLLPGFLQIEKNPVGYVEILRNNVPLDIPVSIAHDGFFVSYAFNLTSFSQNA